MKKQQEEEKELKFLQIDVDSFCKDSKDADDRLSFYENSDDVKSLIESIVVDINQKPCRGYKKYNVAHLKLKPTEGGRYFIKDVMDRLNEITEPKIMKIVCGRSLIYESKYTHKRNDVIIRLTFQ